MTTVYVCPTYACNLSCSHCAIRGQRMQTDVDAIVAAAKQFSGRFVLFGGEPFMLDFAKLQKLFSEIDIQSVSTNLLKMDSSRLKLMADKQVSVATSWNPTRFTESQYETWRQKVQEVVDAKLHVSVLVTLTPDLFTSEIQDVLQDLDKLDTEFFDGVKFEPLVRSSESLVAEADEWLVRLHSSWTHPYRNILADEYKSGNIHMCKQIWTVQPDGSVIHSCPAVEDDVLLSNCLKCKYNKVCRPCAKQNVCTFLEKLYKKVTLL